MDDSTAKKKSSAGMKPFRLTTKDGLELNLSDKAAVYGLELAALKRKKVPHPSDNPGVNLFVPVRVTRVLYVLEHGHFERLRNNHVLAAHEYAIPSQDFERWGSGRLKKFISATSHHRQFIDE